MLLFSQHRLHYNDLILVVYQHTTLFMLQFKRHWLPYFLIQIFVKFYDVALGYVDLAY